MRLLQSNRAALLSLIIIWILARLYAAHMVEPFMETEIQQARKLLEYGFAERHGASLWSPECTGTLPNPEAFNYTHHPYPFFWLLTGLLAVAGPYGILAFTTLLKLAGYILTFKTFDVRFGRSAAWLGTLLYGLAPCGLLEDLGYSCVTQSALLWPVGAWLLVGRKAGDGTTRQLSPWGCAILAFLAGQVDWLALAVIPGLVALVHDWSVPWRASLQAVIRNPRARALILGATASALLFAVQVVIYHPDMRNLSDWLAAKSGATGAAVSKAHMFALIGVRLMVFAGPALLLGAVLGAWGRNARRDPLALSVLVFFAGFALLVGLIPNYFYMERTVYVMLLFPLAALATAALQHAGKFTTLILAACMVPGVLYAHLYLSVPAYSPVARQLAELIARHSAKDEVVLTNLNPLQSPFSPGDVPGGKATGILSDRRIYFGIDRLDQISDLPKFLKRSQASLAYFQVRSRPVATDLESLLGQKSLKREEVSISFPVSAPTMAERLRAWAWHNIMRKSSAAAAPTAAAGPVTIQIYHLDLPAGANTGGQPERR